MSDEQNNKPLSPAAADKLSRVVDKLIGPIDATLARDPVLVALHNAREFNQYRHKMWLMGKCAAIQKTAKAYPPDHIYKTKEWPAEYFAIKGYARDGHVILTCLGTKLGSADCHVDPAELTDVTDELKKKYGLV